MGSFPLALALGPLALYLLLLGVINLGRRPLVTSGARDSAALAVALCGFVIVGPMQLFVPENAAVRFGPYVWVLLISFYGLCVTLYVLVARPRIVIYNQTAEGVKGLLGDLALRLDADSKWVEDSVNLPQLGVQLYVEGYRPMRNVSLLSVSQRQSYSGWQRLETELTSACKSIEVATNRRGFSLLACGLLMISYPIWLMVMERDTVAQQIMEMLRM